MCIPIYGPPSTSFKFASNYVKLASRPVASGIPWMALCKCCVVAVVGPIVTSSPLAVTISWQLKNDLVTARPHCSQCRPIRAECQSVRHVPVFCPDE